MVQSERRDAAGAAQEQAAVAQQGVLDEDAPSMPKNGPTAAVIAMVTAGSKPRGPVLRVLGSMVAQLEW